MSLFPSLILCLLSFFFLCMPKKKTLPAQHQDQKPGREYKMTPAPEFEKEDVQCNRLVGKTAIITGGDSGIGRAVAVRFAQEGADVAVVYLEEDTDAKETQKQVQQEEKKCLLIKGDLTKESFSKKIVEKVQDDLGSIDILVNNAAYQEEQKNFIDITPAQWKKTFETNIFAYYYLTHAVLPHLKGGDSIINTTSVTAYRGSSHLVDYSSTKGAIVSFTRSLALNLAPKKIRVNAVAPGPIWTPFIPSTFPTEQVKTFGTDVPLGRAGQPEEVAPAFAFLASADATYITGQVVHPNGGEIVNA